MKSFISLLLIAQISCTTTGRYGNHRHLPSKPRSASTLKNPTKTTLSEPIQTDISRDKKPTQDDKPAPVDPKKQDPPQSESSKILFWYPGIFPVPIQSLSNRQQTEDQSPSVFIPGVDNPVG